MFVKSVSMFTCGIDLAVRAEELLLAARSLIFPVHVVLSSILRVSLSCVSLRVCSSFGRGVGAGKGGQGEGGIYFIIVVATQLSRVHQRLKRKGDRLEASKTLGICT